MSLDLESVTDPATYVAAGSALKTVAIGELHFETGGYLPQVEVAYETWGKLNTEKTNAVLIQHALTGDSHVASSAQLPEPGWWEYLVGPGKPIDTDKWFVIATNMIGGCYGSTGPSSLDEDHSPMVHDSHLLPFGTRSMPKPNSPISWESNGSTR